jgi:hypothetical protein
MVGRNEQDALESYARPFKAALSCVCEPHLGSLIPEVGRSQALVFRSGRVRLLRDISVRDDDSPYLYFIFSQYYQVIEDVDAETRERFRVATEGWKYDILDDERRELLSYHWHPQGQRGFPHIHIGSVLLSAEKHYLGKTFSALHLPTERISIEQVVRLLIEELEVVPRRPDWDGILEDGQREFEAKRSWPRNRYSP